jgi:hypothetical protein
MAYQTVNPYDNQIVATFDDLTDEQVMAFSRRRRRHLSLGARHRSASAPRCMRLRSRLGVHTAERSE